VPVARALLYAASIGALALVARSLLVGPVPLAVAGAATAGYVALFLCGVLFLRLGMFVDVVARGPRGARGVALTFDDGPSPEHTPKVLDMLDEAGAKATFFVIGRKAEAHPELVREIAARGHAIGLHGYAHDRLFSLRSARTIERDLARAAAVIERITGARPALFRPPIGHTSPPIARVVDALDLDVVGWSARGLDGLARARPDRVAARVIPGLRDGAIVLLHDAAERDDHTPACLAALPRILSVMSERNLAGVRVDAWLDDDAADTGGSIEAQRACAANGRAPFADTPRVRGATARSSRSRDVAGDHRGAPVAEADRRRNGPRGPRPLWRRSHEQEHVLVLVAGAPRDAPRRLQRGRAGACGDRSAGVRCRARHDASRCAARRHDAVRRAGAGCRDEGAFGEHDQRYCYACSCCGADNAPRCGR
jgi:peptidoglycan-N-acetylglucosamine deacetylase